MNFFFAEMPKEVSNASPGQMVTGWHEEGSRYEPDRSQTKEAGELLGAYQRIEDIEHSTSWKLTSPVRALKRLFMRH